MIMIVGASTRKGGGRRLVDVMIERASSGQVACQLLTNQIPTR